MSIRSFEYKLVELTPDDSPPADYAIYLRTYKTNDSIGGDGVYTVWACEEGQEQLDKDFARYLEDNKRVYRLTDRTNEDIEEARAWVERMKLRESSIDIWLTG